MLLHSLKWSVVSMEGSTFSQLPMLCCLLAIAQPQANGSLSTQFAYAAR
ncbi:MAG: hypothetical protein R3E39_16845 [Anaerolineae bacterium]